MGERADDLQQPIEIDDRSPEQNLEYQRQSADEVNVLGTGLGKEAADSFLIMLLQVIIPQLFYWKDGHFPLHFLFLKSYLSCAVQSLWQLGDFQDECMKLCHSHHNHIGDPCIVCAFF